MAAPASAPSPSRRREAAPPVAALLLPTLLLAAFFRTRSLASATYLVLALGPAPTAAVATAAAAGATATALLVANVGLAAAGVRAGAEAAVVGLIPRGASGANVFAPDVAVAAVSAAVAWLETRRRATERDHESQPAVYAWVLEYTPVAAVVFAGVAAASAPGLAQAAIPAFGAVLTLLRERSSDTFRAASVATTFFAVLLLASHALGIYTAHASGLTGASAHLTDVPSNFYRRRAGVEIVLRKEDAPSLLSRAALAAAWLMLRLRPQQPVIITERRVLLVQRRITRFVLNARAPLARFCALVLALAYRGILGMLLAGIFVSVRMRRYAHGYGELVVTVFGLMQTAAFLGSSAAERASCSGGGGESDPPCGELAYRIGGILVGYEQFGQWPNLWPWLVHASFFLRVGATLVVSAVCYLMHLLGVMNADRTASRRRETEGSFVAMTPRGSVRRIRIDGNDDERDDDVGTAFDSDSDVSSSSSSSQSSSDNRTPELKRRMKKQYHHRLRQAQRQIAAIAVQTLRSRIGIRVVLWLMPFVGLFLLAFADASPHSPLRTCTSNYADASASRVLPTIHILYLLMWLIAPARAADDKIPRSVRVMRLLLVVELVIRYSFRPIGRLIRLAEGWPEGQSRLIFCAGFDPRADELFAVGVAVSAIELFKVASRPKPPGDEAEGISKALAWMRTPHSGDSHSPGPAMNTPPPTSLGGLMRTLPTRLRRLLRLVRLLLCRGERAAAAAGCIYVFSRSRNATQILARVGWWQERHISCQGESCSSASDVLALVGVLIVASALYFPDRVNAKDSTMWLRSRWRVRRSLRQAACLFAGHLLLAHFFHDAVESGFANRVKSAKGIKGALFGLVTDLTSGRYHKAQTWVPFFVFVGLDHLLALIHALEENAATTVQKRLRRWRERRLMEDLATGRTKGTSASTAAPSSQELGGDRKADAGGAFTSDAASTDAYSYGSDDSGYVTPASDTTEGEWDGPQGDSVGRKRANSDLRFVTARALSKNRKISNASKQDGSTNSLDESRVDCATKERAFRWVLFLEVTRSMLRNVVVYWSIAVGLSRRPNVIDAFFMAYFLHHFTRNTSRLFAMAAAAAQGVEYKGPQGHAEFDRFCDRATIFGVARILVVLICRHPLVSLSLAGELTQRAVQDLQWLGVPVLPLREPFGATDTASGLSVRSATRPYVFFVYMCMLYSIFFKSDGGLAYRKFIPERYHLKSTAWLPFLMNWMGLPMECFIVVAELYPLNILCIGYSFLVGWALRRRNVRLSNVGMDGRLHSIDRLSMENTALAHFDRYGSDTIVRIAVALCMLQYVLAFDVTPSVYARYFVWYDGLGYYAQATWRFAIGREVKESMPTFVGDVTGQTMLGIVVAFGVVHAAWCIRSADEAFGKKNGSKTGAFIINSHTHKDTAPPTLWSRAKASYDSLKTINKFVIRKGIHTAVTLLVIELLLLASHNSPDLINLGYHVIVMYLTHYIVLHAKRLPLRKFSILAWYNIFVIYAKLLYQPLDPFVSPRSNTGCPAGTRNCGVRWFSIIGLYRLYASDCSRSSTDGIGTTLNAICASSALELGKGLMVSIAVFLLCSMHQRMESLELQHQEYDNKDEIDDVMGVKMTRRTRKRLDNWRHHFTTSSEKRVLWVVKRARRLLDQLSETSGQVNDWVQATEQGRLGVIAVAEPAMLPDAEAPPAMRSPLAWDGAPNDDRNHGAARVDDNSVTLHWVRASDVKLVEVHLRRDYPAYMGDYCRVMVADGGQSSVRIPAHRFVHLVRPVGATGSSASVARLARTAGTRFKLALALRARHDDGTLGPMGEPIAVEFVRPILRREESMVEDGDVESSLKRTKRRLRAYAVAEAVLRFIHACCLVAIRAAVRFVDPVLFPNQLHGIERLWKLERKSPAEAEARLSNAKSRRGGRSSITVVGTFQKMVQTLYLIVPAVILSHTELYVHVVFVVSAVLDASLLSVLPVVFTFLYFAVEFPLAPRGAWLALVTYSGCVLTYRYVFLMETFCLSFDEAGKNTDGAQSSATNSLASPPAQGDEVIDQLGLVPKGRHLIGDPARWYISMQPYCPTAAPGSWAYASTLGGQFSYARTPFIFWSVTKRTADEWSHQKPILGHLLLDVLSLLVTIVHIRSLHLKGLWHKHSLSTFHADPDAAATAPDLNENGDAMVAAEAVVLSVESGDGVEIEAGSREESSSPRLAKSNDAGNSIGRANSVAAFATSTRRFLHAFVRRAMEENAVYAQLSTVASASATANQIGEDHNKSLSRRASQLLFGDEHSSSSKHVQNPGGMVLKPGVDLYPFIFFTEVVLLVVAVTTVGTFRPDDSALPVSEDLKANRFSAYTVVAAMLHVALIIVNRACYLRVSMRARLASHCVEVISVHAILFGMLPYLSSNVGVWVRENSMTRLYYLTFSIHMALSAVQIRYGYVASSEVHQHFLAIADHDDLEDAMLARASSVRERSISTDSRPEQSTQREGGGDIVGTVGASEQQRRRNKTVLALTPFQRCARCFKRRTVGYIYIAFSKLPFVLELTSLLDWTFTDTCLDPFSWLIFVVVAHKVHIAKLFRDAKRDDNDHTHGLRRQNLCCKCWQGSLFAGLILLMLLLPITLFSDLNPTLAQNPVEGAMLSVALRYEVADGSVPATARYIDLIPFPRNDAHTFAKYDTLSTSYLRGVQDKSAAISAYGVSTVGTDPTLQCALWDAAPSHAPFFVSLDGLAPLRASLAAAAEGTAKLPHVVVRFSFRRRGPPGAEIVGVHGDNSLSMESGDVNADSDGVSTALTRAQCSEVVAVLDRIAVANNGTTRNPPDLVIDLPRLLPTAFRLYPLGIAPKKLRRPATLVADTDYAVDRQSVRLALRSSGESRTFYWTFVGITDATATPGASEESQLNDCERRAPDLFVACTCGDTSHTGVGIVLFSDRYLRGLVENLSLPSYGIGILYGALITTIGYGALRAFMLNLWQETPIYAMRHPERLEGICQAMRTLRGVSYPSKHVDEARLYRLLMLIVSDQHVMAKFTSQRMGRAQAEAGRAHVD